MDTLYDLYFHFCCKLALETWAKGSSINPLEVHDHLHTHLLASLQWSGLSYQWILFLTENRLQCQKSSPYKGRGAVSTPICGKKERNGPASADNGLSTDSQESHYVHVMS